MTEVRSADRPAGVRPGPDELTTASTPDRPGWLPDEATLNRLAGEFFSALPGAGPSPAEPVAATSRTPGGVEHAPRVDVPARSKDIPAVPGDAGGSGAATPLPPPSAPDLPGLAVDDPAAAGYAPGRAVPDVGEAILVQTFVVVVIGGVGSFPGAVLGGLIAGEIISITSMFNPGYSYIMLFVAMTLVLVLRPHGLLGVAGRE